MEDEAFGIGGDDATSDNGSDAPTDGEVPLKALVSLVINLTLELFYTPQTYLRDRHH